MKRKICLIMVTVMVMFAVAGCGNSVGKAEEKADDPKPEVGAVEDESADGSEDQERSEEVSDVEDQSNDPAEDNESEPAEAGNDQSSDTENVDNAEVSDEPVNDENTSITDEDIEELKSYIKEAVISEYLEPNGLTVDQLEWPEEWGLFLSDINSMEIDISIGMQEEVHVNSPTDAVLNGILKWLEETKINYTPSYLENVMHKLGPVYEVIPNIDYSAE